MSLGFLRRRHPVLVEVYTRVGCGLCEHAERLVAEEARSAEIRYVDVDADPELQRRYHVRVPVVAVNGHEVAEAHLAPGCVRRAVRRARRGRSGSGTEGTRDGRTRTAGDATKEGT
ncbi:MAG: glutaredoxin family protein [Actinomycetota bacterium]|nr:glutaredoxin family protein [Actinomycetota bacterium]